MLECQIKRCTGCGGCAFVCPVKAIVMQETKEGFLYPNVDASKCIDCNLCNKVCPAMVKKINNYSKKCYAVQLKNRKVLKNTASGGAFFGIAEHIINKGGVVFGVEDEGKKLSYIGIDTVEELHRLSKSKYYQCDLSQSIYAKISEESNNRLVLLSGTPCMISSFKNQPSFNHKNILFFEIICQGVPSKKIIDRYYDEKEKIEHSPIIRHDFRSKEKYVGKNYLNKYVFQNGKVNYYVGEEDDLSLSFQRQIFLRESCYKCFYANESRIADFVGGDLWAYDLPDHFNIQLGCSVLLCNSSKAESILKDCETLLVQEIDEKEALKNNMPYHKSVKRPLSRSISYKMINAQIQPRIITYICCAKYYIKKKIMEFKK